MRDIIPTTGKVFYTALYLKNLKLTLIIDGFWAKTSI